MSQRKKTDPIESKLLKDLQERIRFSFVHNWGIPPIFNEWLQKVAPLFKYDHVTRMEAKKEGYRAMTYSYSKKEYLLLEKAIGDVCRGELRDWVIVKEANNNGLELWITSRVN